VLGEPVAPVELNLIDTDSVGGCYVKGIHRVHGGFAHDAGECSGDRGCREQAQTIRRSAGKLADAVALLEGFQDSRSHLAELRELEDVADQILHDSVSSLFMARADPLEVIRWKDIHESLEEAMDACESAADVLEAIVVKNR